MPWSMFLGPIVSLYFMLTIEGCYPLYRNIVNTHLVKHGYVILHIGRVLAFCLYCTCFMMTCLPWSILHIMYLLVSMWPLCSFHDCNTNNTMILLTCKFVTWIAVDDFGWWCGRRMAYDWACTMERLQSCRLCDAILPSHRRDVHCTCFQGWLSNFVWTCNNEL